MREYINVYQLDDIGNDKVRFDDYLLISKNALSYKFRVGELRDFVIDGIDTTLPIYNANQLMGYGLNFTPPLRNYQLLTFDELSNSWVNRELDIDAVFRFSKFEPNKFLRLDSSNKVITSDVYVSDLVVDTPLKADHFLKVDVSGSSIEYVDVYAYIDNAIDTKSGTFIPLLNAEIDRATNEEIRIESLLNSEINRATNEEIRIENKFDTLISTEITRIENDLNTVGTDLRTDLDNEILRATNEEIRIETLLSTAIQDEEDRAIEEERRLEELIHAGLQSASDDLNDVSNQLNDALQAEINRATAEEIRIEGLINDERSRAISEETRIENLLVDLSNSTTDNINRIDGDITDLSNTVNSLGEVESIANTLVKRDSNGTSKFSAPTNGEHPIRLSDTSVAPTPNTVVMRDGQGKIDFGGGGASDEPVFNSSITGMVAHFAMASAPPGWLIADGRAVSRSTYAKLFSRISTLYGSGNGSTTFNLPDLRGEFIRGVDNGRGVDPARHFGSPQSYAIENITGYFGGDDRHAQNPISGCFYSVMGGGGEGADGGGGTARVYFDASRVVNTASETRPRNIALLPCIKY